LVLTLPAGSHTAALQWRVFEDDDAVSWTSLNRVTVGYQGGEELLMLVNHQSNEPTLIIPETRRLNATLEDTETVISGAFISNINPSLSLEYNVGLIISSNLGVVTLATSRYLTFSVGDGTEDEVMYFTGTVDAVNAAILSLTYRPLLNVYGNESLTLTVTDLMYLGTDEAFSHTQAIDFEVKAVNDLPTIMAPAVQSVMEDGTAVIRGVSVYDADVISASESQYEVTVSVSNGLINLYDASSEATTATSTPAASITYTSSINIVNSLLQHITYTPNKDYNSFHSAEKLVVAVKDLSGDVPSESVSVEVPISVQAENDAPLFVVPHQQQITLSGFSLSDVDTFNSSSITATLSVDNSMASLLVTASSGVTFVQGAADAYSRSVSLQGSLTDVSAALGTLKYMRNSTSKEVIDGGDSITVQIDDSGTKSKVR